LGEKFNRSTQRKRRWISECLFPLYPLVKIWSGGVVQLRFTQACSIQPILDSQAGHLGEVGRVAGQERSIVRQSDAGDFPIQVADAQALVPELDE